MRDEYHTPLPRQFLDNASSPSSTSGKVGPRSRPCSSPLLSTSPSLSPSPSSSTFPFSSSLSSSRHSTDSFFRAAQQFWDGLCCGEPLTPLLAALREGGGAPSFPPFSSSSSSSSSMEDKHKTTSSLSSPTPLQEKANPKRTPSTPGGEAAPPIPTGNPALPSTHQISYLAQAALLLSVEDPSASEDATAFFLSSPEIRAMMLHHWKQTSPQKRAIGERERQTCPPPPLPPPSAVYSMVPKKKNPLPIIPQQKWMRTPTVHDSESIPSAIVPLPTSSSSTSSFTSSSLAPFLRLSFLLDPMVLSQTVRAELRRATSTPHRAPRDPPPPPLSSSPSPVVSPSTTAQNTERTTAWQMEALQWLREAPLTAVTAATQIDISRRIGEWRTALESLSAIPSEEWTEVDVAGTVQALYLAGQACWRDGLERAAAGGCSPSSTTDGKEEKNSPTLVDEETKKDVHVDGVRGGLFHPTDPVAPTPTTLPHGKGRSVVAAVCDANRAVEDLHRGEAPSRTWRHADEKELGMQGHPGKCETVEDSTMASEKEALCGVLPAGEVHLAEKKEAWNDREETKGRLATSPSAAFSASHRSPSPAWKKEEEGIPHALSSHASHLRFLSRMAQRVLSLASYVIPSWSSPAVLHHVLRLYGYTPSLWHEACRLLEQALGLDDGHASVWGGRDREEETAAGHVRTPHSHRLPDAVQVSSPKSPTPQKNENACDTGDPMVASFVKEEPTVTHARKEVEEKVEWRVIEEGTDYASPSLPSHATLSPPLTPLSSPASPFCPFPSLWTILADEGKGRAPLGSPSPSTPEDGQCFHCRPLNGMRPNTLTLFHALQVLQPHCPHEWERALRYTAQLMNTPYHVPIAHDVATVELILRCCIQGHRRTEALYYMALCNASRAHHVVRTSAASEANGIRSPSKASVGFASSEATRRHPKGYSSASPFFTGDRRRSGERASSIVRELRVPLQEPLARLLCERTPEMGTTKTDTSATTQEGTEEKTKNERPQLRRSSLSPHLSAAEVYACPRSRDGRCCSGSPDTMEDSAKDRRIPHEWPFTASHLSAEELSKHFSRHTLFRAYNGLLQQSKTLEDAEWYRKKLFSIRGGVENESLAHLVPLYAKRGKWEAALHSLQELIYHPRRQARFLPTAALHDTVQYALEQAPPPGPSWEVSMKLFKDMIETAQVPLSEVAFQSVVKKCFSQGASVPAQKLFEYMIRHGVR